MTDDPMSSLRQPLLSSSYRTGGRLLVLDSQVYQPHVIPMGDLSDQRGITAAPDRGTHLTNNAQDRYCKIESYVQARCESNRARLQHDTASLRERLVL
jgi:hypothetical protein